MFMKNMTLSTDLSTSIPQTRSIFVIFVHFGSNEAIERAIASLRAGSIQPNQVIVVDHADVPLTTLDPSSIVYREPNTGYAAGLEAGIAQAGLLGAKLSDLCLLVNNDVVFKKNSLQDILEWWNVNGDAKVLAGASSGYVSLFSGKAHITSSSSGSYHAAIRYIHGSCMVAQYGLLSSVRLPSELFLYWEDVVWSMNLQKQGVVLRVFPSSPVSHNDTDTEVSDKKLYYLVRNGAYVLERYTSPVWRVYWYGMNTLRMMYHFISPRARHAHVLRALIDARRGNLGQLHL